MGKSAPKAPDPYATANAQSQANTKAAEDTLRLNSINQYSPYGSATFQRDANGLPTSQTISFAPGIQSAFDAQTATQGNVANFAQNLSGQLPGQAFSLNDVPAGLDVAGAIQRQSFDAIRPEIDNNRNLLNIQLSERGIPIGSEISNNERNRFDRNVNQTYADIGNQSVLAAQGEQQRQLQNKLLERTQGINEIAAALQGGGALSSPNFAPQAQAGIGAADIAGLIQNNYQNQTQQYNQGQASKGNLLGSLGSAALLGF